MLVNGNDFYCGNSSLNPAQLALKSMIPDVSGFATSADLNSLKTSVSSGKSLIASAVTGKGVNTAADASFQTIANNVNAIPTGNAYGTFQVPSSSVSASVGSIVYLSACHSDLSMNKWNIETFAVGPNYMLFYDRDNYYLWAVHKGSTGEILTSYVSGSEYRFNMGPFENGRFACYNRSTYYIYNVNETGIIYVDSTSSTPTDTKYTAPTPPFTQYVFNGYSGSSKIDESYTLVAGKLGSGDRALTISAADASGNHSYSSIGTCHVRDGNFTVIHTYNGVFIYGYDSLGYPYPAMGISTTNNPNSRSNLIETIFGAKVVSNNGTVATLQNLGPV